MQCGADVVCFSHLRYDFVFQRPNHLMSRCARERRVYWVEEPHVSEGPPRVEVANIEGELWTLVPHVPRELDPENGERAVAAIVARALRERRVEQPIVWFYTPMALPLANELDHSLIVYDCMDELSLFRGASPRLAEREQLLFQVADLVFTGGHSLYAAKRPYHRSVHSFPSSVDAAHFTRARTVLEDPEDQRNIPRPRIGFFGVIDERTDIELLATIADERADYQFVLVGPVVKIDDGLLPDRPNLHYLGQKKYEELPGYLAGWDVAMMPFALNESTRFISPTKTLEYLAAAKPVVSTAIRDVMSPYGERGAVRIASIEDFSRHVDAALATDLDVHRALCDAIVAETSWDTTWHGMARLMDEAIVERRALGSPKKGTMPCSTI
jgi:glycosyltransferase involved in cell wall biosynthesis